MIVNSCFPDLLQNEEMHAEGELRNNLDDSERVRELQDKVAELKAEVCENLIIVYAALMKALIKKLQ